MLSQSPKKGPCQKQPNPRQTTAPMMGITFHCYIFGTRGWARSRVLDHDISVLHTDAKTTSQSAQARWSLIFVNIKPNPYKYSDMVIY